MPAVVSTTPHSRLDTLDYLRGIAAVTVCLIHFSHGLPRVVANIFDPYGKVGVQIFFVISGFIIPYSLARANYTIRLSGRFLLKRALRLYPPFFVALILTFLASLAVSHFKGAPLTTSLKSWGYSALLINFPPENPVFWTLSVEAVYYVFIALTFPLFFSKKQSVGLLTFALACALAFFGKNLLPLFWHLPFFLVGFAVCRRALGLDSWLLTIALCLAALAASIPTAEVFQILGGGLTALVIALPSLNLGPVGRFFGAISYSLYLVHFPIGVKMINLMLPHCPAGLHSLLGFLALATATGVAYILYRFVETPAILWSQKVNLRVATASA